MNKEFCTYEQSLALKELGFDEPCLTYYHENKILESEIVFIKGSKFWNLPDISEIAAPLCQQAFRFFREKYKLHSYIYSDYSWNISGGIWDLNGYKDLRYDWDSEPYATYEEAESACLDKLIEIIKNK